MVVVVAGVVLNGMVNGSDAPIRTPKRPSQPYPVADAPGFRPRQRKLSKVRKDLPQLVDTVAKPLHIHQREESSLVRPVPCSTVSASRVLESSRRKSR